jgi:1,4-alpha-glucan branching enzyme
MMIKQTISEDQRRIAEARYPDPFSVLGLHRNAGQSSVCVFAPGTEEITILPGGLPMTRIPDSDFFTWSGQSASIPDHYQLSRTDPHGNKSVNFDPYCFLPQLNDYDLHLFSEGKHWHIYQILGAHPHTLDGIKGVLFATWAPNAERVSVIGDFNNWDGRQAPMRNRVGYGVWELFIPGLTPGAHYKFEIRNRDSGEILTKTDPYAQQFEKRPNTASIIRADEAYPWRDDNWMLCRAKSDWLHEPMSIYELGNFLNYREIAHRLVDYIQQTGFTHIELLPITEHPLDASWGYQTTGYFAATSRFGSAEDFRYFVDTCHQHGIGVILDWVPAHFPKDAFGLARFDGSALYEHEDPRQGEHRDWGTLIYNYSRKEVKNFLLASALFWLEEFHLDGLRVDAVASMLYLDYSRAANDWIPNIHGGNENIEAIEFFRELNTATHANHPGTVIMAEESTSWPQVTKPTDSGGLGFSMKWNMGWMHDTLAYMSYDPVYRNYHHKQLTFGLLYLFSENFVLPFSHDEVVHGKRSMLYKMPGDEWQRFANLRLLYTYMFTYPGKKLLFMGCEFAQGDEWNHDKALDWYVLQYPNHQGIKSLVGDLNRLYRAHSALHHFDFDPQGFEWIDCENHNQSTLAYLRKSENEILIIVCNFTPVIRKDYRIGVPLSGQYEEIFNSDSSYYEGTNLGNSNLIYTDDMPRMGRPYSISLTLPPLAGIIIKHTK